MLTVAMAIAAVYGVLQLAVLGWPARSVGLGTLLLAVGVGVYGAGMVGILLELAYTRGLATVTDDRLFDVVHVAGYTVDPLIEEIVKIVPLLVAGAYVRTRTQWGFTDYLLVGAAVGGGFGLLEAVLRFSHQAENAVQLAGGWLLPISAAPPFIPGFGATLTSWLPAPVSSDLLGIAGQPDTYLHLAYSAVAGFGIGVALRVRGPLRLLGLVPLLLVAADHASYNYHASLLAHSSLGDVASAPFVAAQPLLWLWPLLVLALAVWLDLRIVLRERQHRPQLRLASEQAREPLTRLTALPRYALVGLPWTVLLALRFTRMRRAALYATIEPQAAEPMLARVAEVRAELDATRSAAAWRRRRPPSRTAPRTSWLRRFWPLLVWAVLFVPPLVYFGLGSTPGATRVQDTIGSGVVFLVVGALAVLALIWMGWGLVASIRALPAAIRSPEGFSLARLELQLILAIGVVALGVLSLASWLGGAATGDRLISNVHVLDAVSDALLIVGIALLLGAFIFFPPFGAAALAGGGIVVVSTLTTGFVTLGALGVTSIVLSQAASAASGSPPPSSGGRGGDSEPSEQARAQRLEELARDPAHGGRITDATRQEARIGLDLEESGQLRGPITRDPSGGAEFRDATGQYWDVKGFNSNYPPGRGGYDLNSSLTKITEAFRDGENVIIDTSKMSPNAVQELRAAVDATEGWAARVLWWP